MLYTVLVMDYDKKALQVHEKYIGKLRTESNVQINTKDDLSIAYGEEVIETEGSAIDEENSKINVSYTTGGVTLSATQFYFDNGGNTNTEAAATGDSERWSLSATFAF